MADEIRPTGFVIKIEPLSDFVVPRLPWKAVWYRHRMAGTAENFHLLSHLRVWHSNLAGPPPIRRLLGTFCQALILWVFDTARKQRDRSTEHNSVKTSSDGNDANRGNCHFTVLMM
ncbi:MAG: hypothetical protein NTX48_09940 [Planctomycetales bacterium]|nr:hypothetical protein [Planctomycetales bacterium]